MTSENDSVQVISDDASGTVAETYVGRWEQEIASLQSRQLFITHSIEENDALNLGGK